MDINRVKKFSSKIEFSHEYGFKLKRQSVMIAVRGNRIEGHAPDLFTYCTAKSNQDRKYYKLLMCCDKKVLKEWPLASIIFGNIEMGVRPGKVFISFK